jgi:hypothetical protein
MKANPIMQLATVVVVAVAVMLSATAPARADAVVSVSYDGHLRAYASFLDWGDWLSVSDERKDGLPVAVRFSYIRKNGTKQTGTHWHTAGVDGFGNPNPDGIRIRGTSFGNHNFGERRWVWFHACVRHPGGALTCGKTEKTWTGG